MPTMSPLATIVVIAIVIIGAIALVAALFLATSAERRAGLARMLGRGFVFLIAGSMLLVMVAQFGR